MEEKRHTADSIMELVKQLPIEERVRLQPMLKEPVGKALGFEEYLTEQRFSGGAGYVRYAAGHMSGATVGARTAHRNSSAWTAGRLSP